MQHGYLTSLFGGIIIGIAVSLMLALNGRVTGISGIANGLLQYVKNDMSWRVSFIGGLVVGGIALLLIYPQAFPQQYDKSIIEIAIAGLVVGFGTVMGSGCTSGHGVCGVSRFSIRSIIATVSFMVVGMLTVALMRYIHNG